MRRAASDVMSRDSGPGPGSGQRARVRRKLNVLVVEDDPGVASCLIEILSLAGHTGTHARSLVQARTCIAAARADVVTLDLQLEGELGVDLLEELRDVREAPPVVLVSAYPDTDRIARRHGVAWLQKPFDIDELTRTVEAVARPLPEEATGTR
ncbi:MAG: response regulator [Polyangiales bacterium]